MTPANPFRYGKPVPPDRFVGRADVLRILFSRIGHGESTAVVGEPHMGKSSLLRYIADPRVQTDFGCDQTRVTFQCLDAHTLGEHATPADFWLELAEPMTLGCGDDEIAISARIATVVSQISHGHTGVRRLRARIQKNGFLSRSLVRRCGLPCSHCCQAARGPC